jgi:hypothetical protein
MTKNTMKSATIIIIVVAIGLGAIAGVIYGVTTHREATFAEGAAEWPLESLPLGVTCSGYTPELGAQCRTVERAFGAFNDRVGFKLFLWGAREPVVFVTVGVPRNAASDPTGNGQDGEGALYHNGENTGLFSRGDVAHRCEVRTSNTGDDSTLWVVSYHGAGHCVGLGHDPADYSISVMREVQPDTIAEDGPAKLPHLTDSDRAAVRARYMRQ